MPTSYLKFPEFDTVLLPLMGPFALRWYSLAYLAGILLGWAYTRSIVKRRSSSGLSLDGVDNAVSSLILGIILGGRLGYVFFYKPLYFLNHPLDIFKVWEGGMSFHGGLLGSIIAFLIYTYRQRIPFFSLADAASMAAPIGLFFGRIANFINGELFGRVTDVPWAVLFPDGGYLPRHPSQLYEAALEGLVLFLVLRVYGISKGKLAFRGFISGLFICGYGISRFLVEFVREPDTFLGYFLDFLTLGQLLSIPLIVYGLYLMRSARPAACR